MGILAGLRRALGGGSGRGESDSYWVYAQCKRCGEPLRARVDLRNEPSQADDGETWIVRKGLIGDGERRCFQTVEVTLQFDGSKQQILDSEVAGGKLITEDEYLALKQAPDTDSSGS